MPAPNDPLLGTLRPIGGGDPVPLHRDTMIVGRRPSNDIVLDFEKISGKHCELKFLHGVWSVRDLGSTNGTTVNGTRITSAHSVMPDTEIGLAGRVYTIDYEPGGPPSFVDNHDVLDEVALESRKRTSLMELAGLESEERRPRPSHRPSRPPEEIERVSADLADFDDELPADVKFAPAVDTGPSDDDFFKMIEDEVKK